MSNSMEVPREPIRLGVAMDPDEFIKGFSRRLPGMVSGVKRGRLGRLGIEDGSKVKSWSTTRVSRNSEK